MSTTIATQQFLSFSLTNHSQVIIPTQQLTEVLSLSVSRIVPIPDVSPSVIGVCNWRGEVLWLADLSQTLGSEPLLHQQYRQSSYSVLVTHHNGNSLGFMVEQVGDMRWCAPSHIQPIPPTHFMSEASLYLKGYWLAPDNTSFLVLNLETLMHAIRA